jgi:hypothetical protein
LAFAGPWAADFFGSDQVAAPLEIAILLRDQVYRAGIPANVGVPALTTRELRDWDTAYRVSNIERSRANACNGRSILYMIALRAFGISSRIFDQRSTRHSLLQGLQTA